VNKAALRGFRHACVRCREGRDHLVHAGDGGQACKEWNSRQRDLSGIGKTDRVLQRFGNPDDPNSDKQTVKGQLQRHLFSVGEPKMSLVSHCSLPRTRRE
jgi:hypothetical protein